MSRACLADNERHFEWYDEAGWMPVTLHGATGNEITVDGGKAFVIHEVEAGGHPGASTVVFVDGLGPILCRETREEVLGLIQAARVGK